jgi:hypothetical protein
MYIIVKTIENNGIKHFSMLAANGTYVDDNLQKAVMFPSVTIANKQKDVLAALNPDDIFTVKEIVLQDVSNS